MVSDSRSRQEIDGIKKRNERVETDKAWETSVSRRVLIAVFTYLAISLYAAARENANGFFSHWMNRVQLRRRVLQSLRVLGTPAASAAGRLLERYFDSKSVAQCHCANDWFFVVHAGVAVFQRTMANACAQKMIHVFHFTLQP